MELIYGFIVSRSNPEVRFDYNHERNLKYETDNDSVDSLNNDLGQKHLLFTMGCEKHN